MSFLKNWYQIPLIHNNNSGQFDRQKDTLGVDVFMHSWSRKEEEGAAWLSISDNNRKGVVVKQCQQLVCCGHWDILRKLAKQTLKERLNLTICARFVFWMRMSLTRLLTLALDVVKLIDPLEWRRGGFIIVGSFITEWTGDWGTLDEGSDKDLVYGWRWKCCWI